MITITGQRMTSNRTAHTASRGDSGWTVTWLPGQLLTQNQAVTAMTIADIGPGAAAGPLRAHIDGWAAELGTTAADAIEAASRPPAPQEQEQA